MQRRAVVLRLGAEPCPTNQVASMRPPSPWILGGVWLVAACSGLMALPLLHLGKAVQQQDHRLGAAWVGAGAHEVQLDAAHSHILVHQVGEWVWQRRGVGVREPQALPPASRQALAEPQLGRSELISVGNRASKSADATLQPATGCSDPDHMAAFTCASRLLWRLPPFLQPAPARLTW